MAAMTRDRKGEITTRCTVASSILFSERRLSDMLGVLHLRLSIAASSSKLPQASFDKLSTCRIFDTL